MRDAKPTRTWAPSFSLVVPAEYSDLFFLHVCCGTPSLSILSMTRFYHGIGVTSEGLSGLFPFRHFARHRRSKTRALVDERSHLYRRVANAAAWQLLVNRFQRGPYWKVIMSVRVSVGAFGFKGTFVRLPLP